MINEHMSNERTFLSWIRTGIGIMVFGFVIVKFSLFVNQLPSTFFKDSTIPKNGLTIFIGISLVLTGAITILLSYWKYRQVHRLLQRGEYLYSTMLLTILTVVIFLMSIIIITYLIVAAYPFTFLEI
ncbi:YidH family protein [Flavobacterium sp. MMLR14_040]|uniref:YidH family protein n=1 Tax=Flavobacterium sp. MMLR14_040 TaxID=3093843 RepID=UPI0039A70EDF